MQQKCVLKREPSFVGVGFLFAVVTPPTEDEVVPLFVSQRFVHGTLKCSTELIEGDFVFGFHTKIDFGAGYYPAKLTKLMIYCQSIMADGSNCVVIGL